MTSRDSGCHAWCLDREEEGAIPRFSIGGMLACVEGTALERNFDLDALMSYLALDIVSTGGLEAYLLDTIALVAEACEACEADPRREDPRDTEDVLSFVRGRPAFIEDDLH